VESGLGGGGVATWLAKGVDAIAFADRIGAEQDDDIDTMQRPVSLAALIDDLAKMVGLEPPPLAVKTIGG
jgi:hypothetical protein